MTYLVVIGDTGGNADILQACLEDAGVTSGTVPQGKVVIHVGDVVRCHPQFRDGNRKSVELTRDLCTNNPSTYIQLLGNHESAVLGGPHRAGWDVQRSVDDGTVVQLHELWRSGSIRLASAHVTTDLGAILVTHAGLTRERWRALGSPSKANAAAAAINRDVSRPLPEWSQAGLLVGQRNDHSDTTWAEVNLELYEPWIKHRDAPFSQIHGHASPYNWGSHSWWPGTPEGVRSVTRVEYEHRRTITALNDSVVGISVDWNLGDSPVVAPMIWPLLTLETG